MNLHQTHRQLVVTKAHKLYVAIFKWFTQHTDTHRHIQKHTQTLKLAQLTDILLHWFNSHLTTLAGQGRCRYPILYPLSLYPFPSNCQFACALHVSYNSFMLSFLIPIRFILNIVLIPFRTYSHSHSHSHSRSYFRSDFDFWWPLIDSRATLKLAPCQSALSLW